MLAAASTEDLSYVLYCSDKGGSECDANNLLVNSTVGSQSVNLEVVSKELRYTLCLKALKNLNVSVMVSRLELNTLGENGSLLLRTSSTRKTYLSLYQPNANSSLVL